MTQTLQKTNQNTAGYAKPKALEVMASRLNYDPTKLLSLLKNTVFKSATDDELAALVLVANEYGLNPLTKEIYAFPAKGGGICPIVSVDGWNKMLLRQEGFDGMEFSFEDGQDGLPYSCTATVHVKGRSHPVIVTEYYSECVRNTEPWKNMPRRMLRNRTLCQASRMAFGFAGVNDPDEAQSIIEVESSKLPPKRVSLVAEKSETQPEGAGDGTSAEPTHEKESPQTELSKVVTEAGFTFDQFRDWAGSTNNIPDADSLADWSEIKASDARRILRGKVALLDVLSKTYQKSA